MPDLKALTAAAQKVPLRLPLVFPALAASYRFDVNASRLAGGRMTAEGQFFLSFIHRSAQGTVSRVDTADSWSDFVRGRTSSGAVVGFLGNHQPPTAQAAFVLTQTDSLGAQADFTLGRYVLTRLQKPGLTPDSPAASVEATVVAVSGAPEYYIDDDYEHVLTAVQELQIGSFRNQTGPVPPTPSHAQPGQALTGDFALQVAPVADASRYVGTLYAARQDAESLQALIQAAGQLAYSAERLYLTRRVDAVAVGQLFVAEGRRWTITERRPVGRRHMLLSGDSAG